MRRTRSIPLVLIAVACSGPAGADPALDMAAVVADTRPGPEAVTVVVPPPTTTPPAPTTSTVVFASHVGPVSAADLGTSWREGCPVAPAELRLLRVTHHTFDGGTADGELVVHADVAADLAEVFGALFDAGFPIERMELVQAHGSDDGRSMAANNTSAFNCRPVTGGSRWSEHAFGRAIDINPVQNPYVRGTTVLPAAGAAYLDRSDVRPGMLVAADDVVAAFAAFGWSWGGTWPDPDYQHLSTSGR